MTKSIALFFCESQGLVLFFLWDIVVNVKDSVLITNLSYYPDYGGVENSINNLSKAFRSKDYKVIILVGQSKNTKFERITSSNDELIVRFRFKPFSSGFMNICFTLVSMLELIGLLLFIRVKYSPIIALSRNQFISPFVSILLNIPNIYLAPGFAKHQQKKENLKTCRDKGNIMGSLKRRFHMGCDYIAVKTCSKLFLFSNNMQQQALSISKDLITKIKLVKPGVDFENFKPVSTSEKKQLKKTLNIPQDRFIILAVGRFVAAKGYDLLIQALLNVDKSASLVLVGDGRDNLYLRKLVKDLKLNDRVIFPGKTSSPADFYKCADLFVMSSRYEPLGQTLLESAASGVPVLSFKSNTNFVNASHEVLGDTCLFPEKNTIQELSNSINLFIELEPLKQELLSENIFSLAKKSFSWSHLADFILDERK